MSPSCSNSSSAIQALQCAISSDASNRTQTSSEHVPPIHGPAASTPPAFRDSRPPLLSPASSNQPRSKHRAHSALTRFASLTRGHASQLSSGAPFAAGRMVLWPVFAQRRQAQYSHRKGNPSNQGAQGSIMVPDISKNETSRTASMGIVRWRAETGASFVSSIGVWNSPPN